MSKKRLCVVSCVVALTLVLSGLSSASLVGWWTFDETSGTIAHDSSGGGHDGTLNGSPVWVAGYYDGALKLNGTSDYVQLDIGSLIPTLKECTFSIWVNWVGGASWQRFIDIGTGTADYIYFVPADAGNVLHVAIVANNATWDDLATSNPLPTGGWHHVAATVSASAKTMIIYVDGQVVGSDTTMTNSVDAIGVTTNNWLGRSQYSADPYFNGTIDDFRIYNTVLSQADVRNVMANVVSISSRPVPANNATDVRPDAVLGWRLGQFAATHDVYLGTSSSDVAAASRASTKGVLVSQGQDANAYDPPGLLTLGQTYYWRVDEINAPASPGTAKGNVWNFTAEPVAYAVTNITVTASSAGSTSPAINTINGSGMTGDLAGTDNKTMWLTTSSGPKPAWIRYDFDRLYKLSELWVWNQNTAYELLLGFGAKSTMIEYSADGTTWTKLGDFQFTQAPGTDNYAHDTTVSFGGVAAKSVRITINSSWGGGSQTGLSEVRFYYIPVVAREPNPASGSTGIDPAVTLSWRPGREAVSHNIYVGTDANAVKASTTPTGTATTASYAPAGLQLSTTYYWRVDEVNPAQAISTWAGDVWSFTTPDFRTVDDFESYTDSGSTRIFDIWADGYGTTTNGSVVGHNAAPFAEQTIVRGGKQSMPFAYNNTGSVTLSEATRTFASAQDWTAAGIKTVVLFFRGAAGNTAGQLYVKINGTKVTYTGDSAIFAATVWKQWNIDLASVSGVNLKAVATLTIGVTGSGSGTLYFDDIRLYKSAPAVVQPADPGTANLMAYYAMNGDAKDSKGGYNGTLNNITFANSMTGFGQAAVFNGTTGYIDLGAAFGSGLVSKLTNSTYAMWVNYTGSGAVWQRVIDFGSSSAVYLFMTTRNATSYPRFAIMGSSKAEVNATAARVMSVGWHHLAGVVDASAMTIALYVDGSLVQGGVATTVLPKDLGATTNNWIGRSQFTADPYLNGSVDDLRIYNRVLSAGEVSYLAGDR